MTKSELMLLLDKRLSILNEAEREDIKQDYAQHIEMKMSEGSSEAEAIASLGDIETIIDETLMAYNIDPNYDKSAHPDIGKKIRQALNSEFAQKTGETLNKGIDAVHKAVQSNTPMDILKAVFKFILYSLAAFVLFVLGFCIFSAISKILHGILPHRFWLDDIVSGALMLMYTVVYVAAVFIAGYSFITKNAKQIRSDSITKEANNMNESIGTVGEAASKINLSPDTSSTPSSQKAGTAAKIFDIFLFILKICIFFAVLPLFFGIIGMMTVLGLFLTALFMGYPTLGICLICLGISICMITFLIFVFKLIFGEGGNKNEA